MIRSDRSLRPSVRRVLPVRQPQPLEGPRRDPKRHRAWWVVSAVAGLLCILLVAAAAGHAAAQPKPEGEMRWALYAPYAPDPGELFRMRVETVGA